MYKITIRLHKDDKGIWFEAVSQWKDIPLGLLAKTKENAIEGVKNSIGALETYGDKLIVTRSVLDHPHNRLRNFFKRLYRKWFNKTSFMDYQEPDFKRIPKDFNREKGKAKIQFEIDDQTV